jgi:hypothetical protein
MYASNCTIGQLQDALEIVNKKYDNQVIWNQEPIHYRNKIKFTLKTKTNVSYGHGISWTGRQLSTACWHVHGDFFDFLFTIAPDAKIYALGRMITKTKGNWLDFNRGSVVNPRFASELCECNNGYLPLGVTSRGF